MERIQCVLIRDVIIPQGLEDAMSQRAQAEGERQSRVILGGVTSKIAGDLTLVGLFLPGPAGIFFSLVPLLLAALVPTVYS